MHKHGITIPAVLDEARLQGMHEAALAMLDKTGMFVANEEIREALAARSGFVLDGHRVRIRPAAVEAWMAAFRKDSAENRPEPIEERICRVADRPAWVVERDHCATRPSLREDAIAGAKLIRMLESRGVRGATPCVPTDVPLALQPFEQFMIGAAYSSGGGLTANVCDIPTERYIREMNSVYGRGKHISVWYPSPLSFSGDSVDMIWHFRHDTDSTFVGSMPIMGLTGPCDPVGTMTLAMAEAVGGATILTELLPDVVAGIFPHPQPANLRTGTIVLGSPEWELLELMHRDVIQWYGGNMTTKLIHTMSNLPDAQAQIEHSQGALLGALGGYKVFEAVGQLAIDGVWCPVQLLLDLDIIDHAHRITRGADSGAGLDVANLADVVDRVVREDITFAESETTVPNIGSQYWEPALLHRMDAPAWRDSDMGDLLDAAQTEADRLIGEYDFDPPLDILKELNSIYTRAKDELG